MDPINIFLTTVILINLLLVVIASVGYKKGEERGVIYTVYLINIAAIIWWLSGTVFFRIATPANIFFYTKNLYVSATLIASSFYYFSYIFPDYKYAHLGRLAAVSCVNLLIIIFIIFGGGIIRDGVVNVSGENAAVFGPYFSVYALYILYYFCTSFVRLFIKYKGESDMTKKAQLFYVSVGYSVSGVVAFVADLALPLAGNFDFLWIGPAATICVASFITYAVKKHRLFSIRMVAVELAVFALWVFTVIRISAFGASPEPLADVFYLMMMIILGALLIGSIKKEMRQRERNEGLVEELTAANMKLEEVDLLRTKFISLATHHMASPLTAMEVYASFLKDGGQAAALDEVRNGVGIERIADSFIGIIKDFLDISKLEAGEVVYAVEDVNISEALSNAVVGSAAAFRKGLKIVFARQPARAVYARTDREKFGQALRSILENSTKYSRQGESIMIELSESRGRARIVISDNAERVLPSVSSALVKKFSSAGNEFEANIIGNSLGLYVAKQTIEKQSGSFCVRPGQGTKTCFFTIEFKIA